MRKIGLFLVAAIVAVEVAFLLTPLLAFGQVPDAGQLAVRAVDVAVVPAAPAPSAVAWLRAGDPPNWQVIAAALWLIVTALLKASKRLRANEPLELVANGLVKVPLVGQLARAWTTPESAAPARIPRDPGMPGAALVLVLLSLASCGASTKTIVATTAIATVQTVDQGIETFTTWAVHEEDRIASAAIAGCSDRRTVDSYKACTDTIVTPRRTPIDKAKSAIRIYRQALAAGGAVAAGDIANAAAAVVGALAAVGITVGGG